MKVLVKKILVVDDEEEIRDFLSEFFKERDYAVICASNPEEAMKAIQEEKPLVVLLDIRMRTPGDGIEILKWIRANKFKVKVIMVTAVENEEVMQEAYKIGADKLGNVYPAGSFEGTCNYGTNSTVSQGLADIFHAKITQPGSGIEQEEENLQVLLFPNPATETFSLSLLNRKDAGNLFLYSSTGELIRTWELMSGANHCSLSGIPAGIYFYRVSDDGNRGAAGKLLVQ